MAKMKAVQPQMAMIKERFADDKVKQQQAMMELYKKEQINPIAGCLPIAIQIPVFFSLYKVLFITIEMRHAPFYGWIHDLSAPDPTNIFTLGGLIPFDPTILPLIGGFLHLGFWPAIMGVTMWVQMKLNPAPPDPTQQMIFNWMPLIFTFMLAKFPAGLVIYWAWNNSLSVAQQSVIMHRHGAKISALGQSQGHVLQAEAESQAAGGVAWRRFRHDAASPALTHSVKPAPARTMSEDMVRGSMPSALFFGTSSFPGTLVLVPLWRSSRSSEAAMAGPSKATAVLIVEDEPLVRFCAVQTVEEAGFAVIEAANADEAIAILESRRDIRVVFTDIHMPGSMDGLKLAHAVRDRWPPIKIIVTSGRDRIGPRDLPDGGRFFAKPYDPGAIKDTLRAWAL